MSYRKTFILTMLVLISFVSISFGVEKWTNYTDWLGINAIVVDGKYVWGGTHRGVVRWDMGTGAFLWFTNLESPIEKYIVSIAKDRQGSLWFGAYNDMVWRYDGSLWKIFTASDGFTGSNVSSIAVDKQGAVWFSSLEGVWKFDGASLKNYTTKDGLVSNGVSSIEVDKQGVFWFGTYGYGVSKFDGATWKTYTTFDGLASNNIFVIKADNQGSIWFGTNGGGVSKFDGISWKTFTTADGLISNKVYCIAVDNRSSLWFGTIGYGVSKFDGVTWKTYTTADGLVDNTVNSIAIDDNGALWFGTYGGVSKFEEQTPTLVSDFQSLNHPESFGIRSAYPNPFNPSTTIDFTISRSEKAALSIYNISGQLVEKLVDGMTAAGSHRINWNAANSASGVYLLVLESGGMRDMRKVMFVK